jgi:hypothetical protein
MFLKKHSNVPIIWAHFMGNGRGVQPYPEHWKYLNELLADPAFKHVSIDLSWGAVIAPHIIDTPEHLRMTADLIRKYPDRFLYGSDQGATSNWNMVKKSYAPWDPLWKGLGPELTKQVTRDNYIRIFDRSRQNMRTWEKAHPELVNWQGLLFNPSPHFPTLTLSEPPYATTWKLVFVPSSCSCNTV